MQGDGLLEHVRDTLLPKYETMPPYATVLRSHVVAELNGIADRANEADEELRKGRPLGGQGAPPRPLARRAADGQRSRAQAARRPRAVGRFAEARLDKTPAILQNWLRVRKWCAKHGGRAPSLHATSRTLKGNETFGDQQTEASLGTVIRDWKREYDPSRPNSSGRPYEADVRVLVRDFPKLLQAIRTKDEQAADSAAHYDATIAFMKKGLADSEELRAFPEACAVLGLQPFTVISTGLSKAETARLRTMQDNFMKGSCSTFATALLAAADDATKLTRARVQRIVDYHAGNVADHREKRQQSSALSQQRKHAKAVGAGMPMSARATPATPAVGAAERARAPSSDSTPTNERARGSCASVR